MESWLPLAILTILGIALARSLKGLTAWVAWMIVILLAGATVQAALADPLLVTGAVVLAAAYAFYRVRRTRKAKRDKEERAQNGGVHIHNYYPGQTP